MSIPNQYRLATATAALLAFGAAFVLLRLGVRRELGVLVPIALYIGSLVLAGRVLPRCPHCGADLLVGRQSWLSMDRDCPRCHSPLDGARLSAAELEAKQWRELEADDPRYARLVREELAQSGQSLSEWLAQRRTERRDA